MAFRRLSRAGARSAEDGPGGTGPRVRLEQPTPGCYREALAAVPKVLSQYPKPDLAEEQASSFHDLISGLTCEYDRVRGKLGQLIVENTRLQCELQRLSSGAGCGSAGAIAAATGDDHAACSPVRRQLIPAGGHLQHCPLLLKASQGSLPKPAEPHSPRPPPQDEERALDQFGWQFAPKSPPGQIAFASNPPRISFGTDLVKTEVLLPERPANAPEHPDPETPEECAAALPTNRDTSFRTNGESSLETGNEITHEITEMDDRKTFQSTVTSLTNDDGPEGLHSNVCEFQLLVAWTRQSRRNSRRISSQDETRSEVSCSSMASVMKYVDLDNAEEDNQVSAFAVFMMNYIILSPNSRVAVMWDCITLIALVYDLVVIPIQAFSLPEWSIWHTMEMTATVIWTCDMCMSSIKGFEVRGEIEMHPRKIARHYLRTWFGFDMSIVGVDWILFLLESGDAVDWLRFSRFRRILRLLRIARLVKVGARFLTQMNGAHSTSEGGLVTLRILGLMVVLVAINHFIACGWYAIGTLGPVDENWTVKTFEDGHHDFLYRYTTSFHWSVTQFTPASMEVYPRNAIERIYNIHCIFFGLLMFSSFVSNMTSSMTHLTKLNVEKRQKRDILMSYMNSRKLSLQLRDTVISFLALKQARKRAHCEKDVLALTALPPGIMTRLRIEVHIPIVGKHPLFKQCTDEEPAMMYRLCQRALVERALVAGEELFRLGGSCKHMYFIVSGDCKYVVGFGEEGTHSVGADHWLCEACLWVAWEHRGQLNSKTVCEITALDAAEFVTIMVRSAAFVEIQRYARMYAHHAERENEGADNVTDLWGQQLRVLDLVQKAFKLEVSQTETTASKVLQLWSGEDILSRALDSWKRWLKEEKRQKLWWYRWSRDWWIIRRWKERHCSH